MPATLRAYASSGAALFSSVVLLGPLAFGLLVGAAATLSTLTGARLPEPLPLVSLVLAGLMALSVAVEGAMVQRHGLAVADRGTPPRRAARYLLIGVTVVAGLISIGRFLALTVPWAIRHGSIATLVLAALVVLAILGALYRTITAARDGYESAREPRRGDDEEP